jgi:hypothetical protein
MSGIALRERSFVHREASDERDRGWQTKGAPAQGRRGHVVHDLLPYAAVPS